MTIAPPLLLAAIGAVGLSGALVWPFARLLRPSRTALLAILGLGLPVALVEAYAGALAGPEFGWILLALLVAPVAEELTKLGVSAAFGATLASAAGAGLGFALIENGLYFFVGASSALGAFAVLVATRAVTDPLLHVTGATLSLQSLRGRLWGLPAAVLVHSTWNLLAIVQLSSVGPLWIQLLELGAAAAGLAALLARTRRLAARDPRPSPAAAGIATPGRTG